MPIEICCEKCGSKYRAPDQAAGRKIRCAKCQSPIAVPAQPPAGEEEPLALGPALGVAAEARPPASVDPGAAVHDFFSGLSQLGAASTTQATSTPPALALAPRQSPAPAAGRPADAGAGFSWDQLNEQSRRSMPKVKGTAVSVTGSVSNWYDRASPGLYRWSRAIVALPLLAASLTSAWRWTAFLFEGFKRVGPQVDVTKVDPGKLIIPFIILILAYWLAWVVANASWLMIAAPLQRAELTSRFLSGLHPLVTAGAVFLLGVWFYLGFTNSEKFENVTVALALPMFIAILVAMFQVRAGLRDGDMPASKLDTCLLICFTVLTMAGGMEVHDRLAGRGWYKEKSPDQRSAGESTRTPLIGAGRTSREQESLNALTWEQLRAQRPTKLIRRGPAPGVGANLRTMFPDRRPIEFPSGGRNLQAFVSYPKMNDPKKPRLPAIVYCHSGYHLNPITVTRVITVAKERQVLVMIPAWRGENGQGGDFEFFAGEVDDAVAAAKWLTLQPRVDPQRIYGFGELHGGNIASLLSLADAPLRMTASTSGIFPPEDIPLLAEGPLPFSAADPNELRLRSVLPFLGSMRRPHLAYIGLQAHFAFQDTVKQVQSILPANSQLQILRPDGNDYQADNAAFADFLDRIERDLN
jgi:hypothetical protein